MLFPLADTARRALKVFALATRISACQGVAANYYSRSQVLPKRNNFDKKKESTMKRHCLLLIAILSLVASFSIPSIAEEEKLSKPNIVLVMADDIGYEWIGCYGGLDAKTPHLDALAKTGMRFTSAFSQPLCTPSRVQIMTGRYNHRNYEKFGYLNPKEITFANLLKDIGYQTCIAGKWQLSGDASTIKSFGFDRHCVWNMLHYEKSAPNAQPPANSLKRYKGPVLFTDGEWASHGPDKYGPAVCCDFICNFIEKEKEGPFLVYYPMILPHDPFVPTPDSPDATCRDKHQNYIDMVQYTDKNVGRIVATLDKLGLRKNTLVIFVGDNGTHKTHTAKTDHGVVAGGKSLLTHAGTHVACIANWPATIKKASVNDNLVDFSDMLPTLVEATGATLPTDRVIDGRSLIPVLQGKNVTHREWVFCHYFGKGRVRATAQDAIWDHRWKLYGDGRMFDLKTDILEKRPLESIQGEALQARSRLEKAMKSLKSTKN